MRYIPGQIMQQRDVPSLVRDLHAFCEFNEISVSELARRTNVTQSTVYRILYGPRSNRVTNHMKKLCDYANISIYLGDRPDPTRNGVMMSALREVWDGSDAGAQAIAKMLLAAREVCFSGK